MWSKELPHRGGGGSPAAAEHTPSPHGRRKCSAALSHADTEFQGETPSKQRQAAPAAWKAVASKTSPECRRLGTPPPRGREAAALPQPPQISPPPGLELVQRCPQAPPTAAEEAARSGSLSADEPSPGSDHLRPAARAPRAASPGAKRPERILRLLREVLASPEVRGWADADGYVPITKLMRTNTELQRETFSSTKTIISTVEAQPLGGVRLAKGRRFVRLQTDEEILRGVAEREIDASPAGEVSLAAFLALEDVRKLLQAKGDPAASVRRALGHEESSSVVCDGWLRRRPRHLQLRSAAEELFSDEHLAADSRLRAKMAESDTGAVPLTWLCSRYADRLGVTASTARAAEVSAAELCKALETSKILVVDPRRLAVRRMEPYNPGRSPTAAEASPAAHGAAVPGKDARVAAQLRQLLDFYFEPFTLQHNRYLVDLVARCVGPPEERGPWVPEALLKFRCTLQDLLGLGRIASALAKTKSPPQAFYSSVGDGLQQLKHLALRPDGHFQLTTPMEVRSFVSAEGAPEGVVADIVRYLAAAREQRGQAPAGTVSVASYALGHLLASRGPHDEQSKAGRLEKELGQVKRQIVLHHSDIVCLQGVDAESPGGGGQLAAALSEEGYGFACARGRGGDANSVFWDRSRWERIAVKESGASLAADLRLIEDPSFSLRVACLRPDLQHSLHPGLGDLCSVPEEAPFIVCADLSHLGGAEGSCLVQELCSMRSAAQEVLGDEIWAPTPASSENTDSVLPARSPASGLNKLRCPDAVLYRGLAPLAVLSGHTEGYLATMPPDEVAKQFPAFRLPIVAAFSFCGPSVGAPSRGAHPMVATSAYQANLFRV